MKKPIFITGIGTGVGKTLVSAIVTQCLGADYWKPIQAGFEDGTDALQVEQLISNHTSIIHREAYKLAMPASPHIAAKAEGVTINIDDIAQQFSVLNSTNQFIVVEGAGGLMVPLNEHEFVLDLIKKLGAEVILVSRNYLGSINHSLLTAETCRQNNIPVLGWIFNDQYLDYEQDICRWSGYPSIGTIPFIKQVNKHSVNSHAQQLKANLLHVMA